jgi:two-component system KDP operon response regulator KdpE
MNSTTILVIDDEPQIRKLLQITLGSQGYHVLQASGAKEGEHLAATHTPDLILLDIGLPDKSGHELLKSLRTWYSKSVIMLSVQNGEHDIVMALDNGATDYLTKPFRTGELLARIRACLRRSDDTPDDPVIVSGDLAIDLNARVVKRGTEFIKLTSTEFNLLALFARNAGKVLTHQFLLKEIWGVSYQTETQYLRVFVAQLRKKIEVDPSRPKHIITASGVGYRFE